MGRFSWEAEFQQTAPAYSQNVSTLHLTRNSFTALGKLGPSAWMKGSAKRFAPLNALLSNSYKMSYGVRVLSWTYHKQ